MLLYKHSSPSSDTGQLNCVTGLMHSCGVWDPYCAEDIQRCISGQRLFTKSLKIVHSIFFMSLCKQWYEEYKKKRPIAPATQHVPAEISSAFMMHSRPAEI